MEEECAEYRSLLDRFLPRELSVEEFQSAYLDRFKNETRELDEPLFELLDSLFGDVDGFSTDPALIAEHPDFYLDEEGLRQKVDAAASRLSLLLNTSSFK